MIDLIRSESRGDAEQLLAGDAVATQDQPALRVHAIEQSELLLFDMA